MDNKASNDVAGTATNNSTNRTELAIPFSSDVTNESSRTPNLLHVFPNEILDMIFAPSLSQPLKVYQKHDLIGTVSPYEQFQALGIGFNNSILISFEVAEVVVTAMRMLTVSRTTRHLVLFNFFGGNDLAFPTSSCAMRFISSLPNSVRLAIRRIRITHRYERNNGRAFWEMLRTTGVQKLSFGRGDGSSRQNMLLPGGRTEGDGSRVLVKRLISDAAAYVVHMQGRGFPGWTALSIVSFDDGHLSKEVQGGKALEDLLRQTANTSLSARRMLSLRVPRVKRSTN